MELFDLHCDTLTELFDKGESFEKSSCHIGRSYYDKFAKYAQVCAVFSKAALDDEACYKRFFNVVSYFEKNGVTFCRNTADVIRKAEVGLPAFILSVEDGRLLSGDLSRLRTLYEWGVRILTPLWSGVTCVGGSFDTDEGLSDFGRGVVCECLKLGIIPDISHASIRSASEILSAAEEKGRATIASHSNSYSVFPHTRNLSDSTAKRIRATGGIIGISFAPFHLAATQASSESVFEHIDYYLSLLGTDCICIGGDFDGIDITPEDITCQGDMDNLYNTLLRHNYTEELCEKLFFDNAMSFIRKNL